ncbi:MAG: hypothetical protein SNJ59_16680 [Aggregatilineales bacterium]
MPITVDWYDAERTIIHIHYFGRWTWAEVSVTSDSHNALRAQVSHRVDYILEYQRAHYLPPRYGENFRYVMATYNLENCGLIVFVRGRLIWELYNVFVQAGGRRLDYTAYAESVEEAEQLIRAFQSGRLAFNTGTIALN